LGGHFREETQLNGNGPSRYTRSTPRRRSTLDAKHLEKKVCWGCEEQISRCGWGGGTIRIRLKHNRTRVPERLDGLVIAAEYMRPMGNIPSRRMRVKHCSTGSKGGSGVSRRWGWKRGGVRFLIIRQHNGSFCPSTRETKKQEAPCC